MMITFIYSSLVMAVVVAFNICTVSERTWKATTLLERDIIVAKAEAARHGL